MQNDDSRLCYTVFLAHSSFRRNCGNFKQQKRKLTMQVVNNAKAGRRGRPIKDRPEYEKIEPGQAIVVPESESVTKVYQRLRYWGQKHGRTFSINGNQIVRVG